MLRCSDPAGTPWRSEAYDAKGLFYVASFDKNFVQQQVAYPKSGTRYLFDGRRSSSTSPAEVTATGHGVERTRGAILIHNQRLAVMEYHDIARLDPPMMLNGKSLVRLRITGTRTITPPLSGEHQDFMNYFDPETGFLFGGENLLPDADGKLSLSGQPAQLVQPGEPGFDDNVPAFDCGNLSFNVTDEKASHS